MARFMKAYLNGNETQCLLNLDNIDWIEKRDDETGLVCVTGKVFHLDKESTDRIHKMIESQCFPQFMLVDSKFFLWEEYLSEEE